MLPSLRVVPWLAALVVLAGLFLSAPERRAAEGEPLPEFKHRTQGAWINSPPLSRADLLGEVVLIEIWTSV